MPPRSFKWPGTYRITAWLLGIYVLVPIATIFSSFAQPEKEIWNHIASTMLPTLLANSLLLASGVGVCTAVVGVTLGYLTGACDFPGRRFFSWSLALPMAVPPYVMAFIFLGLLDFSGPIQGLLREQLGPNFSPVEVRSLPWIILVISLTLYPYVYLLSRGAFLNQGRRMLEAARTLGYTPAQTFFRVSLPIARPWIVAGVALVLMETLADFGAVSIFNFDTFTTAIYKAWFGFFSVTGAAQLSSLLVLFALLLLMVEGSFRRRMRYFDSSRSGSNHARLRLRGTPRLAAFLFCSLILFFAFLLPLGQLIFWSLEVVRDGEASLMLDQLLKTILLGSIGGILVCIVALLLVYARRLHRDRFTILVTRLSTMGYALPGTVLAVGIYLPVTWTDQFFFFTQQRLLPGLEPAGPILQGSVAVMLGGYLIRFLAVGFGPVESAMKNIKPSMDEAARTMGAGAATILGKIHLPLLRKGLLTALVLVLIDIAKEMPITLMTRPFGWDTLAVKIFELTSEGEWTRAALPGLYLVLAGIVPVMFIMKKMEK